MTDSNVSPLSMQVPSSILNDHQRFISDPYRGQSFSSTAGRDERSTRATEVASKLIPNNNHQGGTIGGPGIIDDGSYILPLSRATRNRTDAIPTTTSRNVRTSEAHKKRKSTTNPVIERRIHFVEQIEFDNNSDDQNSDWKSNDLQQRLSHRSPNLLDEEDETDDDRIDSKWQYDESQDFRLVRQATSKRRKISSDLRKAQPAQQGLPRATSTEDFSGGITRFGSEIDSASIGRISNREHDSEGYRHQLEAGEGGRGATYDVGDTRLYLRSYLTYVYPLCPLEICNDSIEQVVLNTLTSNGSTSVMTSLCVFSLLALGAYLKHPLSSILSHAQHLSPHFPFVFMNNRREVHFAC